MAGVAILLRAVAHHQRTGRPLGTRPVVTEDTVWGHVADLRHDSLKDRAVTSGNIARWFGGRWHLNQTGLRLSTSAEQVFLARWPQTAASVTTGRPRETVTNRGRASLDERPAAPQTWHPDAETGDSTRVDAPITAAERCRSNRQNPNLPRFVTASNEHGKPQFILMHHEHAQRSAAADSSDCNLLRFASGPCREEYRTTVYGGFA